MNKLSVVVSVCSLLLGITALVWVGLKSTPKQAYINSAEVFNAFLGKRELEADLEQLRVSHKSVLDSLLMDIDLLQNKLNSKNQDTLARQKQLYQSLEREFFDKEQEQTSIYDKRIWTQINQYVQDYGQERDYTLIWGADGGGNLMYADKSMDISKEIIQYINQKYEGK